MDRRAFVRIASAGVATSFFGFSPLSRTATVTPAPGMPVPKYSIRGGVVMAYYEKGRGAPVIFCHGFPEMAYSWRHQLSALAEKGYRAIAPDLRGYGLSSIPDAIASYAATEICDDLVHMMDGLDIEKAVFCGHDWGGFIANLMSFIYPQRCLGIISVGSPHNFRPPGLPPVARAGEELVNKAAWNAFMQRPDIPDRLMLEKPARFFNTFMRRGYFEADYLKTLPVQSPERQMDLAAMMSKEALPGKPLLSEHRLKVYVDTFTATGFSGGINWYRAMKFTGQEIAKRAPTWGVHVPYLYIRPEQDPIIRPGMDNGMEDYIPDLERKVIPDCGHSVMEDQPQALSRIMVAWLEKKFPPGR